MKQIDVLKLSDKIWVRKCKGFRIRCRQYVEDARVDILMPFESEAPMDSEVAAWRVAYKLAHTGVTGPDNQPEYTDITVVDDQNKPLVFYATGRTEVLNPQS